MKTIVVDDLASLGRYLHEHDLYLSVTRVARQGGLPGPREWVVMLGTRGGRREIMGQGRGVSFLSALRAAIGDRERRE